jgi:hypothetical protein
VGKIEELRKKLYKKKSLTREEEKKPIFIPETSADVSSEWRKKENENIMEKIKIRNKPRLLRRWSFWISLIVILSIIAAGIFTYIFFIKSGGIGIISSKNIKIEIEAPASIKGGEKISWVVVVQNNNKAILEDANLIVEFPESSTIVGGVGDTLRKRKNIGLLAPGEIIQEKFEAFIFGPQDSEHVFKALLEYRVEGSSAIFEKSESHTVRIIQTPVSVSLKGPAEINIGKEFQIEARVVSNSESLLKGIVLDVEYPQGFEYNGAFPEPKKESVKRWFLGDLTSKGQKSVVIKGKLTSDFPEAGFKASVGMLKDNGDLQVFDSYSFLVAAKKSFLDVRLAINEKSNYVAKKGERLRINLFWSNNLPVVIRNAVLELNVSEEALDLETLSIKDGFYRSSDNSIVWNSSTYSKFSLLEPGEEGVASMNVDILDPLPISSSSDKNFRILLKAKFFSEKIPEQYRNTDIEGKDEKEIKIMSDIQYVQKGLYYKGFFKNSGPLPPTVGKETTYTIVWSIVNSSNDLSDVSIKATLPNYVKWLRAVNPSSKSEEISFNPESREIIWSIEKLAAGTGIVRPAEEISFQISYIPTIDQVGSSPILVSKAIAEGKDDFAEIVVRDTKPAITTDLRNDPQFKYAEGRVVK